MKYILNDENDTSYVATVAKIDEIYELENCDNVVQAEVLGYRVIVGKESKVGDIGVIFAPGSELSESFLSSNNLYRDSSKNKNTEKSGYIENNGAVKAVKFRGHRSDAFFVNEFFIDDQLCTFSKDEIGLQFDSVLDSGVFNSEVISIVKKFVPKKYGVQKQSKEKKIRDTAVKECHFPKHFRTQNYFYNVGKLEPYSSYVITQKLNGTSVRFGFVPVERKLNVFKRIVNRFLPNAFNAGYVYQFVVGSRKFIKSRNSTHYYSSDIWTKVANEYKNRLPIGYIIYGEIIGWAGDKPIQKGYTYELPKGTAELYVYRISKVDEIGVIEDLTYEDVVFFCELHGMKAVPFLRYRNGNEITPYLVNSLLNKNFSRISGNAYQAVPLPEGTVDEGIVISNSLHAYKAKSPIFLQHESKLLEEENIEEDN